MVMPEKPNNVKLRELMVDWAYHVKYGLGIGQEELELPFTICKCNAVHGSGHTFRL